MNFTDSTLEGAIEFRSSAITGTRDGSLVFVCDDFFAPISRDGSNYSRLIRVDEESPLKPLEGQLSVRLDG